MAKVSGIQNVFNAGELSPILDARSDLSKYANGLTICENFIPFVQGSVQRRPGLRFVARVKDSTKATRLLEFEFSTTQAYILETGDQYLRFFRDNGSILNANDTITGATQADPVVITAANSYSAGDEVYISSVVGMTELNNKRYLVANPTGANFEIQDLDGVDIDGTGFTAYTSGGTSASIHEITTPYLEADLFELKIAQSADVLYIAHSGYAPRKLERTGHTSWTLTEIDFLDGPYLPTNTTSTTLGLSGTSGSVTVTASAALFVSTDVGRLIRWKDAASDWTWLKITAFTSSTVVTATIRGQNASATTATVDWRLGVWSETTGYPSAVTFFEDRLWWGGGVDYPQRVDGSNTGDYENYAPSDKDGLVTDSHSPAFTLNSNNVNVIRWMIDDEKGLLVGTVGGEWILRASANGEVITPSNITAKNSTRYGSADLSPLRAGNAILFIQRAKRKLRELAYVFESDGFRAPDLTLLSEHVTLGGVNEMAYQQEPQSIVWGVRNDGELLGFTYERDQDVLGWHRHPVGGTSVAVESVASIPAPTGDRDDTWVLVSRTIDGGTKRYVEYIEKLWDDGDDITDAFFVDSGLTYDSTPTTTISGLGHLEGETVSILADGSAHPDEAVSDGSITLDRSASTVQVGLGYNSNLQTVKPDLGSQDGTAQGKKKRVHRLTLRFWQSVGGKVGRDADNLDIIQFRSGSDPMDQAVPLYTGDKELAVNTTYGTDGQIYFRQDQPLPSNILAAILRLTTVDP